MTAPTFRTGQRCWVWLEAKRAWAPGFVIQEAHLDGHGLSFTVAGDGHWPVRLPDWRVATTEPADPKAPPHRPPGAPLVIRPGRKPRARGRAR